MRLARRIENLPPYLFAELDRKVAEKRAAGADIISLGVGDPDSPTPDHVVEAAREAAGDPSTHRYPSYYGMPELRRTIAEWFRGRFGVELDPDTEVLPLIGSKEGLAHLPVEPHRRRGGPVDVRGGGGVRPGARPAAGPRRRLLRDHLRRLRGALGAAGPRGPRGDPGVPLPVQGLQHDRVADRVLRGRRRADPGPGHAEDE